MLCVGKTSLLGVSSLPGLLHSGIKQLKEAPKGAFWMYVGQFSNSAFFSKLALCVHIHIVGDSKEGLLKSLQFRNESPEHEMDTAV